MASTDSGDEKSLEIDTLSEGGFLMGRQNLTRINLDGMVVYRYDPASVSLGGVPGGRGRCNAWARLVGQAQDYYYTSPPGGHHRQKGSVRGADRRWPGGGTMR
jgi:hypothetical protein